MPNNIIGTGVIFTTSGITQTIISGSVIDFKLAKQAEVKEVSDASNNFLGIGAGKRKKVATLSVLLQTSGSAVNLPNVLDTTTFTNSTSGDCSGSWAITGQPSIDWKNDDFAKASFEITQWVTSTGTLP
jgi:hypothetical protein